MNYTALYRKFRPKNFEEIVGQEHIITTLKNQLISDRVGHAYLFIGGRGTGKTSAAKILARAVNCLNLQNGEPCNQCESCLKILNESATDVIEMDAASNNGVDNIRNLREEINFLPAFTKYRVYIIDEVHMLSTGAFNALLKTLEEPPEHVKFILATTEQQKLPATILSRCQKFDFKKIENKYIKEKLLEISQKENIKITDQALELIAILAEGGMRDALSILERCIQDDIKEIDEEKIKELIGIPKFIYIRNIFEAIVNYNVEQAIDIIKEINNEGKDLKSFIWEIIKYAKENLMYKIEKKSEFYKKEDIEKIAENTTKERILEIIYKLSELDNEIKNSNQKNLLFEVGIIKLCIKLEKNVIEKEIPNNIKKIEDKNTIEKEKTEKKQEVKTQKETVLNSKTDFWEETRNILKQKGLFSIYTNLINTKAVKNGNILEIVFNNKLTSFAKTVFEKQENKEEIENIIFAKTGEKLKIKIVEQNEQNEKKEEKVENFIENSDIPLNIIEE